MAPWASTCQKRQTTSFTTYCCDVAAEAAAGNQSRRADGITRERQSAAAMSKTPVGGLRSIFNRRSPTPKCGVNTKKNYEAQIGKCGIWWVEYVSGYMGSKHGRKCAKTHCTSNKNSNNFWGQLRPFLTSHSFAVHKILKLYVSVGCGVLDEELRSRTNCGSEIRSLFQKRFMFLRK